MESCPLRHRRLRNICDSGWSETATTLGRALSRHQLAALGNGFVPRFPHSWGTGDGVFLQTSISGQIAPKRALAASWQLCPCPGWAAVRLSVVSRSEGPSEGLRVPFRLPMQRISGGISAKGSRLHQRNEELALEVSKPPATGAHQQNLTKRLR